MGDTEKIFLKTLGSKAGQFEGDPKVEGFQKASQELQKLVDQGLTERRGHRLKSATEMAMPKNRYQTNR